MKIEETATFKKAWECDKWPIWLHDLVDQVCNDYVDDLDMSMEQAVAYGILLYVDKVNEE